VGITLTTLRAALVGFAGLVALPATALAVPGAPTGLTAPTPTKVKPALTWTAPTAVGAGIAGYNVYRGATKLTTTPVVATAYTDAGATANQTHTYTVRAVETATGLESPASAAFAVAYDTTAPTAPTGAAAVTPTALAPVLTWTASTDALAGVRYYQVLRGTTLLGTTASLTYTDASLALTGSYSYSIKAEDWAGNVSAAATKTVVFDLVPPATPAGFNPAVAQRTKPTLSWTPAADTGGAGVARYEVWRVGTPDVLAGSPTTTSFTDVAVTAEGSYSYYVRTIDNAGNPSPPTATKSVIYDITPPSVPTGLTASASPTAAKPAFAFAASNDGAGSGVASYRLFRGGTAVATAVGTTVTDSALTTDGSHTYYVTVTDAAGNESTASAQIVVVYDKTAPPVPLNLIAGATPTNTKPLLSWAPGGPDALSGFSHYEVFRGGVSIGTTMATTLTDTALSTSGTYSYTVKAVDLAGNLSTATPPRSVNYDVLAPAIPGAFTAPPATNVKPTLTWTASADTGGAGLDYYEVFRDSVLIGTAYTTSYTETSVSYPDGSYSYTARAVDKAGNAGAQTTPKVVLYDTTVPVTPSAPTAVTAITKLKPAISWTPTTDPGGSGVASSTIYRAGVQIAAAATGTSYQDTALATNGSYTYTLRANDAAGNPSAPSTGVTIIYDTVAPPVPITLSGPSPTGLKPTLTWASAGPDTLAGFSHYEVLRGGVVIGTTTATTYQDLNALSGSNVYTVKAVDLAGNASAASASRTIVWDNTPPGQPTALAGISPTNLPVLTWTAPADVSGINHYDILRNGVVVGSSTVTTFTDTPAPPEGTYVYTVAAVDNAGNAGLPSASRNIVIDTTPPPAPVALTGLTPTKPKPVLNWSSGGPDGGSGFARYHIYRNGALVGSPTGTTHTDSALTVNGSHTYVVKAADAAGNESAPSAPFLVVWDDQPPPPPTGLTGPAIVSGAPHLDWFSGGPDGLSGIDHYDVLRSSVVVGQTAGTSFDDTGLTTDGTFIYTVRAVDGAGNVSNASNIRTVVRDNVPPSIPQITSALSPTRLQPSLTWTPSGDGFGSGVARYDVYRDGTLIASPTVSTYTDDAILTDGSYLYTVRSVDIAGNASSPSLGTTIKIDRVAPTAPTSLTAPTPSSLPHLTWTQSSDAATGGSGVSSYRVFRNGTNIGTVAVADFEDTAAISDDSYSYTVTALDGAGNESAPSAAATVLYDHTPPPQPAGLIAPTPTQAKPSLTWSSGGPDALSGFATYEVLRDGGVGERGRDGRADDAALPVNGSFVYTVRAVDNAGNRSIGVVRVVVWDTTAPSTPADLVAVTPVAEPSLNWTAATDAGGSNVAHYIVHRDGAAHTTTTASEFTDLDGLLTEGTHTYAVQTVDGAGNVSTLSNPVVVSVDRTAPAAPPATTAVTPTPRPVITWNAAADGGAPPSGVDRYTILRGATTIGTTSGTSFQDDGVLLDGTYVYTVRATDRAGNTSGGSQVTVMFDKTPPPRPTSPAAVTPTPAAPALTWLSGGTDNLSGFARFDIYRDSVLIASSSTPNFADTTLASQGPHLYTIRSVDAAGNASPHSTTLTVVYDSSPPQPPTGLTVPTPTNLPHLSWDAGQDDDTGASGLDHYNIYRDGVLVGTAVGTSFDDSSLTANGSYGYAITAVDNAGNESLASRTSIVRFDGTAPLAPTDPSGATPTRLPTFSWAATSDQATGGSSIAGYRVYRNSSFIGETTGTSYTDGHVGGSGHLIYTVRALDAAGNLSPPSPPLDLVVDLDGPQLDNVTFPAQRPVSTNVEFQVAPHDALTEVAGEATWDFGDGFATGNRVSHAFTAPGTYTITVKATDVLGNTTVVANRAITIVTPAGGVPPTVLKLKPIKNLALRILKRTKVVTVSVYSDVPTSLEFILERGGVVIVSRVRRIPSGSSRVDVQFPKSALRKGKFRLTVRATNADLEAARTFSVR
jgi:large repetitive protein